MSTEASLALLGALVLEDGRRWGEIAEGFQIEDAEAVFSVDGPRWHLITRPRAGSKSTDLAGILLVWLATEALPGARGTSSRHQRSRRAICSTPRLDS